MPRLAIQAHCGCAWQPIANKPTAKSSGRDGQIRTADLSLRRRPAPSVYTSHNGSRLCAPRAAAYWSATQKPGRDGQIRTADLSLRRRPLYPSDTSHNGSRLCAPRAAAYWSATQEPGRDGQIRTADLSLRRRPAPSVYIAHNGLRLCAPRAAASLLALRSLVGTGRFELPTCRLGGDRSIHLSYVPAYCHYRF